MDRPDAFEHETRFTWSGARLLGYGPMDETHEEFYAVAWRLVTSSDVAGALAALDAFEDHARDHFGQEESWMNSTGFPPRDCHIDEHARVMASIEQVRVALREGRADERLAQDFAMHLFEWFPSHADHLDSALAAWMCKRAHGGKPVVLRRGLKLR